MLFKVKCTLRQQNVTFSLHWTKLIHRLLLDNTEHFTLFNSSKTLRCHYIIPYFIKMPLLCTCKHFSSLFSGLDYLPERARIWRPLVASGEFALLCFFFFFFGILMFWFSLSCYVGFYLWYLFWGIIRATLLYWNTCAML